MTAHIITIGDELLIGQIINTNSAWMADQLTALGIEVEQIKTVSDKKEVIIEALKAAQSADLVLLTGGLGPTRDDVTKKALSAYFETPLVFHQVSYDRILEGFRRRNIPVTKLHKEQCYLPESCQILTNRKGTAPGMWFEKDKTVFVSMPGVPYEMKYLVEFEVLPKFITRMSNKVVGYRTLQTIGTGETVLAERIEKFEDSLPEHLKLAYLPSLGTVRLRLTGEGTNAVLLEQQLVKKAEEMAQLIPEFFLGFGDKKIEELIGNLLTEKELTMGTAESCTGGHIAHKITSIAGSSAYFKGSIVAYSNEIKHQVLTVNKETVEKYGAVSEQTVKEMVIGALKVLNIDVAISVSGIAGPGGGTEEKPVGTVWVAVGNKDRIVTECLRFGKDRNKNIQLTTTYGLNVLRKFLLAG